MPVLSRGLILTLSCCSVAKSCPTLCYPIDSSMPGLPVPQPPPGVRPSSCPFNSQRPILLLSSGGYDSLCHSYSWQFRFLCVNAITHTRIQLHTRMQLPTYTVGYIYSNALYCSNMPFEWLSYPTWPQFLLCIYLPVPGLSCGIWDLVPWPGSNPGPLHWEHRVLTTGPPGKSLFRSF